MNNVIRPMDWVKHLRRIVVKVGTSVLTDAEELRVARSCVESVAGEIAALWREGREALLVTSGAIGVGMGVLKLHKRPAELAKLQAAAATGQGMLMQWYAASFEKEGFHAAQILLTRADLEDHRRFLNIKATLATLLSARIVPIINENDTVSVEEIRYGDNDVLSAHVAALMGADLLVILSDVDRFEGSTGFPTLVTDITPEMEKAAGGSVKSVSTGGMRTKLEAAKIVMASGIPMILVNGRHPNALVKTVIQREFSGTWFLPKKGLQLKGKQRVVAAFSGKPKGVVLVDAGAKEALVGRGSSLLASGVHGVEGHFRKGDLVSVSEVIRGAEFARGIVNYSHQELEKIKGLKSETASALLGEQAKEVIHRDSLVIL